jgi:hypothetical protein
MVKLTLKLGTLAERGGLNLNGISAAQPRLSLAQSSSSQSAHRSDMDASST